MMTEQDIPLSTTLGDERVTEETLSPSLEATETTEGLTLEPLSAPAPHKSEKPAAVLSPTKNRRVAGCCALPNSSYSFVPSCLTTVSFCLSVIAHFSCKFMQRNIVVATPGITPKVYTAASIGLWSYLSPGNEICYYYPSNISFDPFFKTCRAMAPLAAIIGGIIMITFWGTTCFGMETFWWKICGLFLLFVTFFEGLTFLVFQSDFCGSINIVSYDCFLGTGGRCGVAACVFWFVSAVSVWKVPPPETIPPVETVLTTIETIFPDGTRKIEKKTIAEP